MDIRCSSFEVDAHFFPCALQIFMVEFEPESYCVDHFTSYGIIFPEELHRAVKKRQAEYLGGRLAARAALNASGINKNFLGTGRHREPLWPDGYTGSISHTDGLAISAVTTCCINRFRGLGIDIELILTNERARDIAHSIMDLEEYLILKENPYINLAVGTTMVFSAKESLFKALFYQVGFLFDFILFKLIGIDTQHQTFTLALGQTLTKGLVMGQRFTGVYFQNGQMISTYVLYEM